MELTAGFRVASKGPLQLHAQKGLVHGFLPSNQLIRGIYKERHCTLKFKETSYLEQGFIFQARYGFNTRLSEVYLGVAHPSEFPAISLTK